MPTQVTVLYPGTGGMVVSVTQVLTAQVHLVTSVKFVVTIQDTQQAGAGKPKGIWPDSEPNYCCGLDGLLAWCLP